MVGRAFVSRFSPNRTDPEVLEAIFVQRHRLAEFWIERLRESIFTGGKHHLLAVGPRGSGKSHLVALLISRLRKDPAARERVRIAWLPEDETTPSFWKFLLRILRALNAEYGDEFPAPPRNQLEHTTDDRRSAVLTDYLLKKLDGRTLVVVVENLDEVMRGLKQEGQKRWRAFLQEHPVAATLATAQQLTADVAKRDRPFFNFFQVEHLVPLTADEALSLLQKIAEHSKNHSLVEFLRTPTGRARVRAIRHIAGGSHRVFIIVSEFATRENLDDLVTAFEELLDELTPYYQERLRWVTDQQREIVEFLCRQARTVPVKEIARELFLSEQTAAAQLKLLKDKGYVTAGTWGRESRYELAEPLMRLCVEVKDPQREPIRLIVEFLRIWYDRAGMETMLQCLPAGADLERRYYHAALQAYRPGIPGPVVDALNRDLEAARASGDPEGVVRVLVELAATADSVWRCDAVARELGELGRYEEAVAASERAIQLDPEDSGAWMLNGQVLNDAGRYGEALAAFNRAIELDPKDDIAWHNKGWTLDELGRSEEAIAAYEGAIALDPKDGVTWTNKGWTLNGIRRYAEALAACERAIELDPKDERAWNGKAYALLGLHRAEEALYACERVIEWDPTYAPAWNNKGCALDDLGKCAEALIAYERSIELNPRFAVAWSNKACTLSEAGRHVEAITLCDRAIELDPEQDACWSNKAAALLSLGRYAEAVAAYDRAIELNPERAPAWTKRGRAKVGLGLLREAADDFRHAIELKREYTDALDSLAEALVLQANWDEAERVLREGLRLPRSGDNTTNLGHFPDLITAIFRASTDHKVWQHQVGRLIDLAQAVRAEGKQTKSTEEGKPSLSPAATSGSPASANPLALIGEALVRSLTNKAYSDASADALDAWAAVWQEVAMRHRDLSLATRLFGAGVQYLQTKDERVLLDLVQEERSILRELFGLDEG